MPEATWHCDELDALAELAAGATASLGLERFMEEHGVCNDCLKVWLATRSQFVDALGTLLGSREDNLEVAMLHGFVLGLVLANTTIAELTLPAMGNDPHTS